MLEPYFPLKPNEQYYAALINNIGDADIAACFNPTVFPYLFVDYQSLKSASIKRGKRYYYAELISLFVHESLHLFQWATCWFNTDKYISMKNKEYWPTVIHTTLFYVMMLGSKSINAYSLVGYVRHMLSGNKELEIKLRGNWKSRNAVS